MEMNSNNEKIHDIKVGTYFDRASVTFDTFYDHKRSAFMQWVDKKFRSDVFNRYYRTFETLYPLENKTVLDIGCGSGPYVVEAAKRGAERIVGLDMAESMLDLARQRVDAAGVANKCEFISGTFPKSLPVETFDYSITMGVMDYIADPLQFLTALAKVVQGRCVLSFPSVHWFRTPLRKWRYRLKQCPVYFYKPADIEKMGRAVGFSKVHICKMPGAGQDYFVTLFK